MNATAFVCGLLYITLAVMFGLDALGRADVDVRWLPAVVLIGLGLAGVLGSATAKPRVPPPAVEVAEPPGPPEPPEPLS
jgi:hypothetical protein